ncbi:CgeB family protein [Aeromicrobium sp. CF3.5]|uniref:CgeB family protein n=1 Tax=Aeromicrobium sp. CF3.5 TaxID=3373078 RepID=UPI003EE7FC42
MSVLRRFLVWPTPRRLRILARLVRDRLLRRRRAFSALSTSPLFDPQWVAAQVGRPLSIRQAVRAYGADAANLSPHPLFDTAAVGLEAADTPNGGSPLEVFVHDGERRLGSTHPLIDVDVLRERHPDAAAHEQGPVAGWLATVTDDAVLPSPTGVEPATWSDVRRWSAETVASGRAVEATRRPPSATISVVVVVTDESIADAASWWRQGRADVGGDIETIELVLVTVGLTRAHQVLVDLLAAADAVTSVVPVPAGSTVAHGWNAGAAASSGRVLILAGPGQHLDVDGPVRLAGCVRDHAASMVQPLVVSPDELVVSAGAGFLQGGHAFPLLAGHAISDARAAGHAEIAAPLGDLVAVDRQALLATEGFGPDRSPDAAVVEIGLRVEGPVMLCPDVRVTRHGDHVAPLGRELVGDVEADRITRDFYALAGFDLTTSEPSAARTPVATPHPRLEVGEERLPALRWTIDLASPPGPRGESWGDVHFGRALAAALERRGQRVSVDSHAGRHRPTRDLDDVMLVLRGLDRVEPRPALVNIEWIISHPDLVSAQEARGFDIVFAASAAWSERMTEQWGVPVSPLLQCTDPSVFHPDLAEHDTGPPVLFVGNSRGVHRLAVRAARDAGLDLTLYGEHWEQFLPDAAIAGIYVPNGEVGALYASAGLTLNDHWDDMKREGFMSNRLFDAAASGARIVSDHVDGIADVFGEQVQFFETPDDLRRLANDPGAVFPDAASLRDHAIHVMRDHSFDARAGVLLEHAARRWAERR